jgi:hypothetical protein
MKRTLNYKLKINFPGEAMTQILNDNVVEFTKAMHPAISAAVGDIFFDAFRQYFLSVPERLIFKN